MATISGIDLLKAQLILGNTSMWPKILMNQYDDILALVAFEQLFKTTPTDTEQLDDPKVFLHIDVIKNNIRKILQQQIDSIQNKDIENFVASVSKPYKVVDQAIPLHTISEYGTVDQIATRFNISKSEVRKMKREGTLDKFIESHTPIQN